MRGTAINKRNTLALSTPNCALQLKQLLSSRPSNSNTPPSWYRASAPTLPLGLHRLGRYSSHVAQWCATARGGCLHARCRCSTGMLQAVIAVMSGGIHCSVGFPWSGSSAGSSGSSAAAWLARPRPASRAAISRFSLGQLSMKWPGWPQ